MKKLLSFFILLGLGGMAGAYAGEESHEVKKTSTALEDRAVIYYDFNLELNTENGVVQASWDDFIGEGFDWYKLVYSTTNVNPVYPTDKTVFVGSIDQTEASVKLKAWDNYMRICAITLNDDYSKDRYCGTSQKIQWDGSSQAVMHKAEKKETYKETGITQKNDSKNVSEALKKRVDEIIENFINKLLERGDSNEAIVETIDIVLDRLENHEKKIQYEALLTYMKDVIIEYRAIYDNPLGDLEEIFSDL